MSPLSFQEVSTLGQSHRTGSIGCKSVQVLAHPSVTEFIDERLSHLVLTVKKGVLLSMNSGKYRRVLCKNILGHLPQLQFYLDL